MAEALFKMCLGNQIGVDVADTYTVESLFTPAYGSYIVELADGCIVPKAPENVSVAPLGETAADYHIRACGETLAGATLQEAWEHGIEDVYPYRGVAEGPALEKLAWKAEEHDYEPVHFAAPAGGVDFGKPRVIIPVFPGTNCEYDSERAWRRAGAAPRSLVLNNLSPEAVAESVEAMAKAISESQIVMLPGGFSGGDEPDGSAKFINAFFRNPQITEAVRDLLQARDGLMLGICNGFQALVKLGLVPFGDIRPMDEKCPTLTFNTIGRHQSRLVRTRVASNLSPWLSQVPVGEVDTIAISHGEGRFVASDELLAQMEAAGQIATQYVDEDGVPSMDLDVNPNGSVLSIEGITSPDGRVLGKMGHTERSGNGLYKNVPGNKYQKLFEGGVAYFK